MRSDAGAETSSQADGADDASGLPPPDAPGDDPDGAPDTRPPDARVDRPSDLPDTGVAEASPDLVTRPDGGLDADVRADADADTGVDTGTGCPVDCSLLPNIRPGVVVECRAGLCVVPPGSCRDGFRHCTFNPNDGCETDLSRPESCGGCGLTCNALYYQCNPYNGSYICGPRCGAPYPDACGYQCVDFQTDFSNCGGCGIACYLPNTNVACQQGHCVALGCSDPSWADCTTEPGCDTQLGTDTNCGGCGDKACTLTNTLFTCSNGGTCDAAVCAAGFANCSATSPDCEASFASAPACMPQYLGTTPFATQILDHSVTAVAPDGSVLLAGTFLGPVDFDPGVGRDIRTAANDPDGFITKINADGSYGWTRTLIGRGDTITVKGLAVTASGAILATGWYNDTIDLDPGTAADLHFTTTASQADAYLLKLSADGTFVWGRTFTGSSGATGNANAVAVDAAEAVYVAGLYTGEMDFDPGAGTDLHASSFQSRGMLVKLTAAGTFAWGRSVDNGDCGAFLSAVTVATDGGVWAVGASESGSGCPRSGPDSQYRQNDVLIVKLGAAGDARGSWTVGSASEDLGLAVTAGRDGSVYVGGQVTGMVDFDPGTATAMRWTGAYQAGFVLKLDVNGAFRWVRTLPDNAVNSLAGTPDGGVIAGLAAFAAFVTRLNADGVGVWSFTNGDGTSVRSVASNGASFAIAGTNSGASVDFNPGPDIDPIYGSILYISRFHF